MDMSFAMGLVWLDLLMPGDGCPGDLRRCGVVGSVRQYMPLYHTFSLYLLFRRSVFYFPLSHAVLLRLEFVSRGPSKLGSFVVFVDNSDFYRTLEIFRGEPN